jgi:hypothetical protein
MSTGTFQSTKHEDLWKTWRRHQTARILQRHLQFGQHCRLDLDALLAAARTIRRLEPDAVSGCAPGARHLGSLGSAGLRRLAVAQQLIEQYRPERCGSDAAQREAAKLEGEITGADRQRDGGRHQVTCP